MGSTKLLSEPIQACISYHCRTALQPQIYQLPEKNRGKGRLLFTIAVACHEAWDKQQNWGLYISPAVIFLSGKREVSVSFLHQGLTALCRKAIREKTPSVLEHKWAPSVPPTQVDIMTTVLQSHVHPYFFPLTQWCLHCLCNWPELSQEHANMLSLLRCGIGSLVNRYFSWLVGSRVNRMNWAQYMP